MIKYGELPGNLLGSADRLQRLTPAASIDGTANGTRALKYRWGLGFTKDGRDCAMVRVHVFNKQGRLVGPVESPRVELSDEEWQRRLSPAQYQIVRGKGTER